MSVEHLAWVRIPYFTQLHGVCSLIGLECVTVDHVGGGSSPLIHPFFLGLHSFEGIKYRIRNPEKSVQSRLKPQKFDNFIEYIK
jgi:hypothetical protein